MWRASLSCLTVFRCRPNADRGPAGWPLRWRTLCDPASLWFGWSGRRSATPDAEARLQRAEGTTYATIDLTEAEYRSFYVGFANGALWPLLHFRLGLVEFRREDYEAIARSTVASPNRWPVAARRRPDLGARLSSVPAGRGTAPAGRAQPHRLLPAHAVRAAGAAARTAARRRLLRAMCAFDVVGFHTRTYQRAFLDCVREILPGTRIDRRQLHARRAPCACRSSIRSASTPPASPATAARAERSAETDTAAREPGRTRAGHRGRPARLFQGPGQPLRGIRTAARQVSGASPAGQLPADRRRARARSPAAISVCGAISIASSATPTAGSPNSTGCRCAT